MCKLTIFYVQGTLYPIRGTGDQEITMEVSVTSVLNWGALPIRESGNNHKVNLLCYLSVSVKNRRFTLPTSYFQLNESKVRASHVSATHLLTCGENGSLSNTQCIALLWVKGDIVLCVRLQVMEGVLCQMCRQVNLFWVWTLDSQEETVACNFGTRYKPQHHCTVLSNVIEMNVCGSIGILKEEKIGEISF